MENDLITVVVPIYNVEKYLNRCIDSILSQTYKKLEIILVDDGSPDNCYKICNQYGDKDKRVQVIHKENGGLSDARNCGINNAHGKYITFIDSDDYVEEKYIEKLYNAILKDKVEISQCNILKVDNDGNILKKIGYDSNAIRTGKEMIKDLYAGHWISNIVAWNKMYDIELFKKIRYPNGKIHEDEFTTYRIFYDVKRVSIINEYLYNYIVNDTSIVGKTFSLKRFDFIEAIEERIKFFEGNHEKELYILSIKFYLENLRLYYMETKKYIKDSNKIQEELLGKYKKNYKKILTWNYIRIDKKIKLLFFYLFPKLYYNLKKGKY